MTWMRGVDEVNALLDEARVERVRADDAHARHLWQAADAALHVARLAIDIDASSAFENAYTAAGKRAPHSWPHRACGPPKRAATWR